VEEYLNEKEQWERVLVWLREQGPWILAGVALALAVYGGWNYWQNRIQQRNLAAALRYEQVIDAFARNDLNAGSQLADQLVKAYPSTAYADQANLAVARIQVENKQLEPAAARLRQVLASTSDPELALVVRLRLARVELAQGNADQALKTLDAVKPGAFAARYAQVRGDVLLAKGDRDGALKAYREARGGGDATIDVGLIDLKIDELAHS
jgi:predicted negative regulator of RcsB-dependent stress response